jgi:hypothetical protein
VDVLVPRGSLGYNRCHLFLRLVSNYGFFLIALAILRLDTYFRDETLNAFFENLKDRAMRGLVSDSVGAVIGFLVLVDC